MEHLKEIITDYAKNDSSNPYALLINGAWGSGKTWFINKLTESEEFKDNVDKKNTIYVSLNGISSTNDIAEQVFFGSFKDATDFNKSLIKLGRTGGKILQRWLKIKEEDVKEFGVEDFLQLSECILIFDDLERISSKLPTSDVLGFINSNYVEKEKYKVIIIGNEKEIKKDDLVHYTNEKEKVIGRTIEFKTNFPKVFREYIESLDGLETQRFKQYLNDNSSFLHPIIAKAKFQNLRTFFFFIDTLKVIYSQIDNEVLDELGKQVMFTTFLLCHEYKDGIVETNEQKHSTTLLSKMDNYLPVTVSTSLVFAEFDNEPSLEEVTEEINNQNDEKNELRKGFREKYGNKEMRYFLPVHSISNYIENGFLETEFLKEELDKHLPERLSKEEKALKELGVLYYQNLKDEEFLSNITIVINAVKERKFNLYCIILSINTLFDFSNEKIISLSSLEEEMAAPFESFFINNLENLQINPDEGFSNAIRRQLDDEQFSLKTTFPNLHNRLYAIYSQNTNSYIKEHEKQIFEKFKEEVTLPPANHHYFTKFIVLYSEELIEFIIDCYDTDHDKFAKLDAFINNNTNYIEYDLHYSTLEILNKARDIHNNVALFSKEIIFENKPLTEWRMNQICHAFKIIIEKCNAEIDKEKKKPKPPFKFKTRKHNDHTRNS